jgi:tetratricopeptide (TPR) repeat protein
MLLGAAEREMGDPAAALEILEPLAVEQKAAPGVQMELGLALADLGETRRAETALRRALSLKRELPAAWRRLADMALVAGRTGEAEKAHAEAIRWSTEDPALMAAAVALVEERLAEAEHLLKDRLKAAPTDVAAIRMLAEVAARLGRYGDAETLLRRALELAPAFTAARHNLAIVLYRQAKLPEALVEIEALLNDAPNDPNYRNLQAGALARIGDVERSIAVYGRMLEDYPNQPKGWLSYGHALKTAGRTDEGVAAYRRSIAQAPQFGEAYWSLANLKRFRFEAQEIDAMRRQLERQDLGLEDRFHLEYALGKALEDLKDYEGAFGAYARGAALRRSLLDYDADETTEQIDRSIALFSEEFLSQRREMGLAAEGPIFIVGLPRSGSTLIEQILDCHSAIEGTAELPDMGLIARSLGEKKRNSDRSLYPDIVGELDAARLKALGERYLAGAAIQRRTQKPFFIDKMPNNFLHVGLILSILPNARIIDARRHPMGTCFSAFKQHFARGQNFSYDLADLGRYYADYVRLMAHFDAVAPGRVHRVIYERMVADTEGETRRLLDYCGLPFEDACLRFYENDRAVRTASSEQVRQPIFTDAVEHWRHFEPWLEPLKSALGATLDRYPQAPDYPKP